MADQVLALSLRPQSFDKMYGQEKLLTSIRHQFKTGRIPNSWMFVGETGSGKTTIARILARSLQCSHGTKVGEYCPKCKDTGSVIEVPVAKLNTVEAIKELVAGSGYGPPPPALRRVYILDEAQRITQQAQSVLLKDVEDAPDTTVWIICTTEPTKIIRPLRGRCMVYHMQPLRGSELDKFVRYAAKSAGIDRDLPPFLDILHLKGITSARNILYSLEQYASGLDPEEAILAAECDVDTHRICAALLRGEWGPIRSELDKATADDARLIRAGVLGYLKSIMLNRKPTADRNKVALCIKDLGEIGYQDEQTLLVLVVGALWRSTKRF